MFEVTELATQNLKVVHGAEQNRFCPPCGPYVRAADLAHPWVWLWMSQKKTMQKYEQDGLTFLVDNNLLDTCGSIKVDFMDAGMRSGFSISSEKPLSRRRWLQQRRMQFRGCG